MEQTSANETAFDNMRDAAFEIALRGTDTKTTASLSCVSKDLADRLCEYDLWHLKFNAEFNATWYQSQWTAKDNYKLQKKGGVMNVLIARSDVGEVDFLLYVPCLRRTRMLSLLDMECIRECCAAFEPVALDFRQPLARYCLFHSKNFEAPIYHSSFTSRKEAAAKIHEVCSAEEYEYDSFVLVDITTLVLEFSIPKNIDAEEMLVLENKAKPAFWFCNPYDKYDSLCPLEDVESELDCIQELDEKK